MLADDPPGRVGSLDYLSGEVAYALRGGAGDPTVSSWLHADFNQPVSEDMSVQTGRLARARVRIGPNAIELASETVLDVLNLTDQLFEASLRQGRIYLRVRNLQEGERVEIEIPTGSFWLLKPGAYDIDAGAEDRPARIAVFDGAARFVNVNADLSVEPAQEALVSGPYPATVTVGPLPPGSMPATPGPEPNPDRPEDSAATTQSDEFLVWAMASEFNPEQPQSAQYVSGEMTGHERLDAYGRWETHRQYGPIWFPTAVPADWAPYRFGHWKSIAPWGWTWIDDQPWGFAPFHYGRWVRVGERWAWAPGARVKRPVYAPALVAFLETADPPAAPRVAEPAVGWFPLAPGEAYIPWYAAGPAYVERVNLIFPVQYRDNPGSERREPAAQAGLAEFANRRFATVVQRDAFAYGRPVMREIVRVPEDRLMHAAIAREAPRIVPAMARPMAASFGMRSETHGLSPAMAAPGAPRATSPAGLQQAPSGQRSLRGEPQGRAATTTSPQRVSPDHPNSPGLLPNAGAHAFARPPEPHAAQHAQPPGVPHSAQPNPQLTRPEALQAPIPGRQYARPDVPHSAAPAPQYGRPEVPHAPGPRYGRPEVPHPTPSAGQGMMPQHGRPEVFHTPAPAYHAAAPQYGRPQVAQPAAAMPRMGGPQMVRPGAPAVSSRSTPAGAAKGGSQIAARPAAPARPAGGGSNAQKKK